MGTVLTEQKHDFGFLMTEANGTRSRERGTLVSGNNLQPGAILKNTGTPGEYTEYDGSDTPLAILGAGCNATDEDKPCVVIARDAEVNGHELVLQVQSPPLSAGDIAEALLDVGIVVRN